MRCHYEVLGVDREASDDEVKRAYRKLVLQWHPDKNPDRQEECTKQFHLIQQAYEVLTDPQERAWYDKHREAILRGGLGKGDDYHDNSINLYQYFDASCFSGYGDDEGGFYVVYGQVFKTITVEDSEFFDFTNGDVLAPEFGNSQSSYEEVVGPFYAYWESYCTAKSYVWAEKFDTREAPNRQVRRIMEQENKKLRDKAKKERNEEVRALVGFIRKRDKRVQAYKKKLEERAQEIAQMTEQRKQRDREQRLKVLENYTESNWSSMSGLERELQKLEANVAKEFGEEHSSDNTDEDDNALEASGKEVEISDAEEVVDEEQMDDSLYCVACNKDFKSEKALENHKRSKKHCENMMRLCEEMMEDEEILGRDVNEAQEEEEEEEVVVEEVVVKSRSKKQKKKRRQQLQTTQHSLVVSEEKESLTVTDDGANDGNCIKHKGETEEMNGNLAAALDGNERLEFKETIDTAFEARSSNVEGPLSKSNRKLKKEAKEKIGNATTENLVCNKCHQSFASRNKLFEHISETGHAIRLSDGQSQAVGTKSSKNKKTKRQKETAQN